MADTLRSLADAYADAATKHPMADADVGRLVVTRRELLAYAVAHRNDPDPLLVAERRIAELEATVAELRARLEAR